MTLSGNTGFAHNHCESTSCVGGGGIAAIGSNLAFTGDTMFIGNEANFGGAGIFMINSTMSSTGSIHFIRNSISGNITIPEIPTFRLAAGIICASESSLHFNGISNFINNSAQSSTVISAGAICAVNNVSFSFSGINNLIGNSASAGGGIYTEIDAVINLNGDNSFLNNFINSSGSCYGGAILLNTNSTLMISGSVNFTSNGHNASRTDTIKGDIAYGGGVYVGVKGTLSILPDTTVFWNNNHATYGGAIYVTDVSPVSYCASVAAYVPKEDCFFQLPAQNLSNGIDVQLVFKDNSADVAGSVLYGGAIDNCKLTGLESYSSGEVFDMIVHIDGTDYNKTSNISSDPLYIRPCEYNHSILSRFIKHTAYPGETFQVSVVGVGQRNGAVPTGVRSTTNDYANLLDYQYLQKMNTCTKLNYTVFSLSRFVDIDLHAECGPCLKLGAVRQLTVKVTLNLTCPPGLHFCDHKIMCM